MGKILCQIGFNQSPARAHQFRELCPQLIWQFFFKLKIRGRGLKISIKIFLNSDPVFGARIIKLAQVSTFGVVLSMLEGFLVWWPLFGQKTAIF